MPRYWDLTCLGPTTFVLSSQPLTATGTSVAPSRGSRSSERYESPPKQSPQCFLPGFLDQFFLVTLLCPVGARIDILGFFPAHSRGHASNVATMLEVA